MYMYGNIYNVHNWLTLTPPPCVEDIYTVLNLKYVWFFRITVHVQGNVYFLVYNRYIRFRLLRTLVFLSWFAHDNTSVCCCSHVMATYISVTEDVSTGSIRNIKKQVKTITRQLSYTYLYIFNLCNTHIHTHPICTSNIQTMIFTWVQSVILRVRVT